MIARKGRPAPTTARHVCRTADAVPIPIPISSPLHDRIGERAPDPASGQSPLGSYLEYSS